MKRMHAFAAVCLVPQLLLGGSNWGYTEEGRQVLLHENGTWEYASQDNLDHFRTFRSERGPYAIRYDAQKWTLVQNHRASSSDAEFAYVSGEGYALAIYEPQSMSPEQLKEAVLLNMRAVDPNANVVNQGTVEVGGQSVLTLEIEATAGQLPFTYRGYYYTGEKGSLQFITYTTTNLVHELSGDFQALLDGLTFLE